MKRILMLIVICVMLAMPVGCNAAVTGQQMQDGAKITQEFVNLADVYQQAADQLALTLRTTGLIDPNALAKLEKVQANIDAIQPKVSEIAAAVQNAPYLPDDDTGTVIVKALQAANAASSPVNPYAGIIAVILGIVSSIVGVIAAKQKAKADANGAAAAAALAKYQAHKQGVELTLRQAEADPESKPKEIAALMYKNIGDARASMGVV